MSTSAFAVWECRPGGHVQNGGGFDATLSGAGTDYSQQDSPQVNRTDATTSSASTTVTVPNSGTLFDATMVGNAITFVTSGTFQGFRWITGFTSTTSITIDSNAPTTSAGAATIRVGGASTLFNTGLPMVTTGPAAVAGNKVWVKGTGTATDYTISSNAITLSFTNNRDKPFTVEGYTTTRGDGGRPMLTTSSSALSCVVISGKFNILKHLSVNTTGAAFYGLNVTNTNNLIDDVVCQGIFPAIEQGGANIWLNCEFKNSASGNPGLTETAGECLFEGCTFHGNSTHGLDAGASGPSEYAYCLFYGNTTDGVNIPAGLTHGLRFVNCVFWNNGRDGIRNDSTASEGALYDWTLRRCIFGKNTGYDVNFTLEDATLFPGAIQWAAIYLECNAFYTTGTGKMRNLPANSGDITLTVSPFMSDTNFSLNGTTGGGGALSAAPCTVTLPDSNVLVRNIGFSALPTITSLASMRSLWREYCNERDTTVIPDTTVDIYLQSGLEALNRVAGYYQLTSSTAVTLVAGTQEYSLASDTVEVRWVEWGGRTLAKRSIEEWRQDGIDWRNEPAGAPQEWAHYANKIVLRPTPNAAAVAQSATPTLRYVAKPADITTYGPLQLSDQDQRVPVLWGVQEWAGAHPDSALAIQRADRFKQAFLEAAAVIAANYQAREILP